jgi:hypothetical protein
MMSMCLAKAVIRCPKCNNQMQITRPDSSHPFYSTEKPSEDEGVFNVVEQVLECKNQQCSSKFSLYWYDK